MKTQYIFWILYLFPIFTFCQNESSDKVQLHHSWNISFYPELNFQNLEAKGSGQWVVDTKNKLEIPTMSYTLGITHSIDFDKVLSVEVGFYFSMRRIRSKAQELLWYESSLNPPGSIIRIYNFDHYRFPLIFKFKLGKKRKSFLALGGSINVHSTVHLIEKIDIPNRGTETINVSDNLEPKTGSFSLFIGLGKEFPLKKENRLLRIEPFFSVSTKYLETDFYTQSFYTIGIRTSILFAKEINLGPPRGKKHNTEN